MSPPKSSPTVKVLISICSLVLMAVGIETWLRVFGPEAPGVFTNIRYKVDPWTGPWALPSQTGFMKSSCFTSGSIHINRFGMRDRERTQEARGPRIALLGDSMIQGLQVGDEETVSRHLEVLAHEQDQSVEVLNFGISSTGPGVQWLVYRKHVRPFHPHIVLELFTAANDVSDNLPALKQWLDPQMGALSPYILLDDSGEALDTPQPGRSYQTPVLPGLLSSSALGQWVIHWKRLQAVSQIERDRQASDVSLAYTSSNATMASSDILLETKAWRVTQAVIRRLYQDVTSDGAQFALVVLPGNPSSLGQSGEVDSDTQTTVSQLEQLAEEAGFPLMDLSKAFQAVVKRNGPTPLIFSCDSHWNARAHEEAAQAIYQFLTAHGWI